MELNEKIREKQMSENFILGIMLALTGGFLDAYTYITRGGVFANAQTGNIVLMGINLAKGDFERVIHYVVPILAFALGILLSEIIKATLKKSRHMHWRQIVVLAEIIILAVCGFIPSGKGNTFVNVMVSFVCSLQVETFRVINGNTVATTMCTGNLRSGTELLFLGIKKKDKKITLRSLTYYGINLFFALGAIAGAIATKFLDVKSIFIASVLLVIPFIILNMYKYVFMKKGRRIKFNPMTFCFSILFLKAKCIYKAASLQNRQRFSRQKANKNYPTVFRQIYAFAHLNY